MTKWFSRRADTSAAVCESQPTPSIPRSRWQEIWHIFALSNFAVAQPLYDRLAERPVFLVDLRIKPLDIFALVILLTAVLPSLIVLLEWLVSLVSDRAYRGVHLSVVFILLLLLTMPFIKQLPLYSGELYCCGGLVIAVVGTWCYSRYRQARQLVNWIGLGILVFPTVFLVYVTRGISASLPPSSPGRQFTPAPVVLLLVDEICGSSLMTPEREIDAHRFPNFASLGKEATWFRNATSVHQSTLQAVPAILSGCYPQKDSMAFPSELPQNLFSVLHLAAGYELAAFEPVTRIAISTQPTLANVSSNITGKLNYILAALARVYLFHISPAEFGIHLPPIPRTWFGLLEEEPLDTNQTRGVFRYPWGNHRDTQFQHFLNCVDGSTRPTLHFAHILLPHVPWSFLPSGRRYAADGKTWELLDLTTHAATMDVWGSDELEVTQSQQRHLLQVMYVDHLVGRLVARLKETGQYDQCLLIVIGDHGISFRTNQPRRELTKANQDELLPIPLFIKRPGQTAGSTSDRRVESVDILPTIADVLGITLNGKHDGWSVYDQSKPDRQQNTYCIKSDHHLFDPAIIVNSAVPRTIRTKFGDSSDPEALFRIGPHPELVGRTIESLNISTDAPIEIELLRYGDEVNSANEIQVPCLYEGIIRTQRPLTAASTIVAVAINGTVRAVTRTFQQPGFLDQWAAMVPESAFHDGKNEVKFYTVDGAGPTLQLTRCMADPSKFRPKPQPGKVFP